MDDLGKVISPAAWCRQRWCRDDESAAHHLGDGCTCGPHGKATADEPRFIELTARASRLEPFACRACGTKTRRMVEYPALFFRCEPCAAADRWPDFRSPQARGR